MKLNFKELEIYTSISKREKVVGDARESFADILYSQCNGIKAHSLALRIYESNGEIDISTDEAVLIKSVTEGYCTPAFIDAINEQMNKED